MNIRNLLANIRLCKAVAGCSPSEFQALLPSFEQALSSYRKQIAPNRQRAVGGGKKGALPTSADKLAFILIYLKCYPTYDCLAFMTNRDRSRCCRSVHFFVPVLELALGRELVLPKRQIRSPEEFERLFPGIKDVFIDGTERRTQRPKNKKKQNKLYSGKKKATTRKIIIVSSDKRRVLVLTPTKSGRRHDKRLTDKAGIVRAVPANVAIWTDTGFQGMQKEHTKTIMPKKATKGNPLTLAEKAENRVIASFRVLSEHALSGIKRLRASSDVYRNHLPNLDDQFTLLSAGLWNFHLRQMA